MQGHLEDFLRLLGNRWYHQRSNLHCMNVENAAKSTRALTPEAAAFAAQLRAERARAQMSQGDLSQASGIGQHTILRLENGQRVMDTFQLSALCKALGISITTFVMRAEEALAEERANNTQKRSARRA